MLDIKPINPANVFNLILSYELVEEYARITSVNEYIPDNPTTRKVIEFFMLLCNKINTLGHRWHWDDKDLNISEDEARWLHCSLIYYIDGAANIDFIHSEFVKLQPIIDLSPLYLPRESFYGHRNTFSLTVMYFDNSGLKHEVGIK